MKRYIVHLTKDQMQVLTSSAECLLQDMDGNNGSTYTQKDINVLLDAKEQLGKGVRNGLKTVKN